MGATDAQGQEGVAASLLAADAASPTAEADSAWLGFVKDGGELAASPDLERGSQEVPAISEPGYGFASPFEAEQELQLDGHDRSASHNPAHMC